jgi:hypothetical protein
VRLEPATASILERKATPFIRSAVDLRTGAFDLRGVTPGSYNLVATANGGGRNRTTLFARFPLEITGGDIENLKVSLAPGFDLIFNLRVEGATDNAAEIAKLLPFRVALNGYLAQPNPSQPSVRMARQLPPDLYRVRVDFPGGNGYLKSARFEDAEILQSGLVLNSSPTSPVELTISVRFGSVTGTAVTRDGKPAMNATVVLVPDASRRKQYDSYKNVQSGSDGTFHITGIAPGDYKLFSWLDVDTGAWQDSDFIKAYEELGKSIQIGEASAAKVEVLAIP